MSWTASGVGSLPGEDIREAVRVVLGELPDRPHLPELPARGAIGGMIGRTLAMVTDLGFDLQPAGWRLTDASGIDHRRAQSLLAQDLDVLEEMTQGYAGPLKLQLAGPWTLAACVEKPRGDKVLADVGARRELAQALAEGAAAHVADVRRRVPGASLVVQVDEPALPAVMAGQVPTASGFHRHRSVDAPLADELLGFVTAALPGVTRLAHCCAEGVPIALLAGAGFDGVCVDVDRLSAAELTPLGELLDGGRQAWLGVVPTTESALTSRGVADRVLRLLDMLGFDPDEVADRIVLTPGCGLAGASPAWARQAMTLVREAAATLR